VSRIPDTVELNEETDKRDEVVWYLYIVRTGFAQARPDYGEK
jgi:hypothetical protein